MNFIFNRHNSRRTAVVMVFVWMMSLLAGFTNACVLDSDNPSQRHTPAELTHTHESWGDPSYGKHAEDDSAGLGACKSFCSATEQGISKYSANTTFADADSAPLLIQTWINPATNYVEVKRFAEAAPDWSLPPVHIRFLRLTI